MEPRESQITVYISSRSFKTESDIKESSRHALRKALLYLLEQAVFSDLFSEAYFWLEKCEHEARSYTCHSPRTILATASIFSYACSLPTPLEVYQVSICRANCFTTISPLRNTRHAHCALVSLNLNNYF